MEVRSSSGDRNAVLFLVPPVPLDVANVQLPVNVHSACCPARNKKAVPYSGFPLWAECGVLDERDAGGLFFAARHPLGVDGSSSCIRVDGPGEP